MTDHGHDVTIRRTSAFRYGIFAGPPEERRLVLSIAQTTLWPRRAGEPLNDGFGWSIRDLDDRELEAYTHYDEAQRRAIELAREREEPS